MSHFMDRAIALAAKAGLGERSGGCFGAVIVKDNEIIAEGYNQVLTKHDPTCHAEVNVIRSACKYLNTHILDNCTLYTSSQPCPMCLCACAWARIPRVVYASTIEDAKEYGNFDDEKFYDQFSKGTLINLEHDQVSQKKMVDIWTLYKNSNPQVY